MKSGLQNKLGELVDKNNKNISKMASDFVVNAEQSEFSSPQTALKLDFMGNADILGGGDSPKFVDDLSDDMKHDVDKDLGNSDVQEMRGYFESEKGVNLKSIKKNEA